MGKIIDKKLDDYIISIINSDLLDMDYFEKNKFWILYKSYYASIKEYLDAANVPFETRKNIIIKYFEVIIRYEGVCAKAFAPLSGSQSVAKDLIKANPDLIIDSKRELKC